MLGVFLDYESVDWGDLDRTVLANTLPQWHFFERTAAEQRFERLAHAQIVVSNKVQLDAPLLVKLPSLKLICIAATGTNNVDLVAARAQGITVCHVKDYATPAVVQHTFGLLLALASDLLNYTQHVQAGQWSDSPFFCLPGRPIVELAGKTLGILGYGALGQGMAALAKAVGMEVLLAARDDQDTRPGRLTLDRMLPQCDVLSVHCPLTPETLGCIGEAELQSMPRGSYVLNTARGGIVDEHALAKALRSGHLAGAALDVLSQEPPNRDHLLLKDVPNLLITPHVAWGSTAARQRLLDQIAQNVESFCRGEPQQVVES